jgi:hypothetical protein
MGDARTACCTELDQAAAGDDEEEAAALVSERCVLAKTNL